MCRVRSQWSLEYSRGEVNMSSFVFFVAICLVACQASPSPTGADNRDKRHLPAELDGGNRRFLDLHIHRRSGGGCPGGNCRRTPCNGGDCSEGPNRALGVHAFKRFGCPGGNCRRIPCNGGGCGEVSRRLGCSGGNCYRMKRSAIDAQHKEKRSAFNGDWGKSVSCSGGKCMFGYPGENPCAGGGCGRSAPAPCSGGICGRFALAPCSGGSCGRFAPAPCSGGSCGRAAPRVNFAIDRRSGCSGGDCRRMKRSANPQCPGGTCGLMAMHGGSQAPWDVGYQAPLHDGYEAPWHGGYEAPWHGGYQAPWHDGYEAPRHGGYQVPMHMKLFHVPLYRVPDTLYNDCAGGNCLVKRYPDNGFSTSQFRLSENIVEGDHVRD